MAMINWVINALCCLLLFPLRCGCCCMNAFLKYVGPCKPALFIIGMVCSYSLVESGFVFIIITYFIEFLDGTLLNAAQLTNMKEGVTAVMMYLNAHIADAYVGHFAMVIFSTVTYCIGLILLYMLELNRDRKAKNFFLFMGLILIAQGGANRKPTLNVFFADQFECKDNTVNEMDNNKSQFRFRFQMIRSRCWWGCFSFLGIMIGTFCISYLSWANIYRVSILTLGISLLVCSCGFPYYNYHKPTGRPLTVVFPVFVAATLKCHLDYPLDPCQFYEKEDHRNTLRMPQTNRFRWLNKAAIIDTSSHYTKEEEEKKWRLCTVTQVEEAKILLGMCPMWATFLVYSLVKSTGNTFFVVQANNLNRYVGFMRFGLSSLFLIKFLSMLAVSFLYNLYNRLSKRRAESLKNRGIIVKMGLGMLSSVVCCMIAWRVEVRRLGIVKKVDNKDKMIPMSMFCNKDMMIPMSMFWLVPQYFFLGAMEVLVEDSINNFINRIAPQSMKTYGPTLNDVVVGLGSLLSVVCLYASRRWFKRTLNESHLDKYYLMLIILTSVNLLFYLYFSTTYMSAESAEASIPTTNTSTEPEVEEEEPTTDVERLEDGDSHQ